MDSGTVGLYACPNLLLAHVGKEWKVDLAVPTTLRCSDGVFDERLGM
jgi:hypothetical protein